MTQLTRKACGVAAAVLLSCVAGSTSFAAEAASDADKEFVAKVSQGGMFEVALGRLAAEKGDTQMIKDNGATEAHDHEFVGAKLRAVSGTAGLTFPSKLNADFQGKLDKIRALSGPEFDTAYVAEMEQIHQIDGGLFAREAKDGGTEAFKAFAAETHSIVEMHLGALKGTGIKLLP